MCTSACVRRAYLAAALFADSLALSKPSQVDQPWAMAHGPMAHGVDSPCGGGPQHGVDWVAHGDADKVCCTAPSCLPCECGQTSVLGTPQSCKAFKAHTRACHALWARPRPMQHARTRVSSRTQRALRAFVACSPNLARVHGAPATTTCHLHAAECQNALRMSRPRRHGTRPCARAPYRPASQITQQPHLQALIPDPRPNSSKRTSPPKNSSSSSPNS